MENLPLKKEALRHIGLPVEIKAGFIGKIRLQVPVRQIRTASWVIVIEQLYLVAGPISLNEVFINYYSFIIFFISYIINKYVHSLIMKQRNKQF